MLDTGIMYPRRLWARCAVPKVQRRDVARVTVAHPMIRKPSRSSGSGPHSVLAPSLQPMLLAGWTWHPISHGLGGAWTVTPHTTI
jgi:hypothetical protein